jgi:hypothetical protein
MKNADKSLVGKPEGESILRRPWCRWADNTKMDITRIGCEVVEWNFLSPYLDQCQNPVDVGMNFLGHIKGGVYIHQLNDYYLLKITVRHEIT